MTPAASDRSNGSRRPADRCSSLKLKIPVTMKMVRNVSFILPQPGQTLNSIDLSCVFPTGMWNSREDDQEQSLDASCFPDHDDALKQPKGVAGTDGREENAVFQDR